MRTLYFLSFLLTVPFSLHPDFPGCPDFPNYPVPHSKTQRLQLSLYSEVIQSNFSDMKSLVQDVVNSEKNQLQDYKSNSGTGKNSSFIEPQNGTSLQLGLRLDYKQNDNLHFFVKSALGYSARFSQLVTFYESNNSSTLMTYYEHTNTDISMNTASIGLECEKKIFSSFSIGSELSGGLGFFHVNSFRNEQYEDSNFQIHSFYNITEKFDGISPIGEINGFGKIFIDDCRFITLNFGYIYAKNSNMTLSDTAYFDDGSVILQKGTVYQHPSGENVTIDFSGFTLNLQFGLIF